MSYIPQPRLSLRLAVFLWAAIGSIPTASAANAEPVRRAITEFLDRQAAGLPGPARYDIGAISGAIGDGCRRIAASVPPGTKPWGRIHVQARCVDGANWSLIVPVTVHVSAEYLVSARALRPGQAIVEADLATRRGDLAELPSDILTDPAQAIGQTTAAALPAEHPLRADILRKPVVVRQGQSVRVVSAGTGFQVSSEGKALGNAVSGQVVQIRMPSGQTVSGVARADGIVQLGQ